MTLKDAIDKIKGFFNGSNEPEEPRRELRDKHLESLEREWQFYENQKRKEMLKRRLLELKKQQIREHTFGIKKHQIEKTILDAKLNDSGVDINHSRMQLLKAKKLFK